MPLNRYVLATAFASTALGLLLQLGPPPRARWNFGSSASLFCEYVNAVGAASKKIELVKG